MYNLFGAVLILTRYSNLCYSIPRLLIIAFDGFRWDFVNRQSTPNIWACAKNGVMADRGVKNEFPATTLPNFYSFISGLTTEHHGIVGDVVYDPERDETFDYWNDRDENTFENSRSPAWYTGVPIWQANDEADPINRRTGCVNFPFCDSLINNKSVQKLKISSAESVTENGSHDVGSEWRRDFGTLWNWFLDPKEPINFGLLYIDEPDKTLHSNDIWSENSRKMLRLIDDFVNHVRSKINESTLIAPTVNIMLISDHGHVNVLKDRGVIKMDDYVNPKLYRWSGKSIFADRGSRVNVLYRRFLSIAKKQRNMDVWLKNRVPDDLHYKNNTRIGPVVISERLGYSIASHGETLIQVPEVRGGHGYSNRHSEMWPLFIAWGPAFKVGYSISKNLPNNHPLELIDLYEVMCAVLKLANCPSNDGKANAALLMLRKKPEYAELQSACSNDSPKKFLTVIIALSVQIFYMRVVLTEYSYLLVRIIR